MFRSSHRAFALFVVALCCALQTASGQTGDFYLHDGDTVVFYGDSITEQGYYTSMIDEYTQTRFPWMKVRFFSAGIGGDRVTGGFAGGVDERLERDVFSHQPSVVTIMLGMNDAGYKPLSDETIAAYAKGYEHILETIHEKLPNARITLLGPSPYDEATRPALVAGTYNAELVRFSAIDKQLAVEHNALYVDLNAPVFEALKRGDAMNKLATEMLIPDRIHPGQPLHWIMAAALLKAWNAPPLVTEVSIDAKSSDAKPGHVIDARNAKISGLTMEGSALTWKELDADLPLPLNRRNSDIDFMLKISQVEEWLNQEPLKVTGLDAGEYSLLIDGNAVGHFTAKQLQAGVNLAETKTPMRDQAQSAMWLIRDYEYAQMVHLRLLVRDRDAHQPSTAGDEEMTKFEELDRRLIQAAAQPKEHTFRLEPSADTRSTSSSH